jgi:Lrp/AsnC family transcriptional regulator for asnA, asnC and gidA
MSFLLDDYDENDRIKLEITGGGKKVETDDLDYKILKLLATNARMPTAEIAEKLHSTAITINNRIKKLIKLDVIQGFRIYPDFSKLGYLFYKADITLVDYNKKEQIINYLKRNPHVLALGKSAGYADLELDFIIDSVGQLHQIMEDLTIKFPNTIKNYDYFFESELHKMHFIPQE